MNKRWLYPLICITLVTSICTATGANIDKEAVSHTGLTTSLQQVIDLSIADANLTTAIEHLKQKVQIAVRIEGTVPDKNITLNKNNVSVSNILDALASSYGCIWEQHTTMIVFSPNLLEQAAYLSLSNANLATAIKQLTETTHIPARAEGQFPDEKISLRLQATSGRQLLDTIALMYGVSWKQQGRAIIFVKPNAETNISANNEINEHIDSALNTLREIGAQPLDRTQTNDATTETRRNVAAAFSSQDWQNGLTIRIRDLPPTVQKLVLDWQAKEHADTLMTQLSAIMQNNAFDPNEYLNASLSLSKSQDGHASITISSYIQAKASQPNGNVRYERRGMTKGYSIP